jgi:hypothetical protein
MLVKSERIAALDLSDFATTEGQQKKKMGRAGMEIAEG